MASGVDTSNGLEFLQRRIGLFAQIVALIGAAFMSLSLVGAVAFGWSATSWLTARGTVADLAALAMFGAVWLVARRGRSLSVQALAILDAVALLASCTAWAFFVNPAVDDSIFGSVSSVTTTVLVRAIVVPSSAGRTLRLSALATVPELVAIGFWLDAAGARGGGVTAAAQTVMYQTLLMAATVTMATITSRIIYDLRRRVREAHELGQYALEEKLGAGGMGEVWRARHRFLVRAAAIKLIRPELLAAGSADPRLALRRFEREALATAALRSPHTVQLYDFGQADDGTLFYVMELLTGIDLETLVSRFGPIPAERAVHILRQVCRSLEEAHQNGLIHRDIKPANVFVSPVGGDLDFVKVLDFGLVRFGPEPQAGADHAKLTADGRVGGTPAYIAPEIALGETAYDHRVDLYAVGCVAYWLLTGTLVFEATSSLKMLFAHARTAPDQPTTRTELPIPRELEQLVMECLEKDPARRPQSAAALADRLAAVPLPEAWTRERADAWWRTHLPQPAKERPVAEVLLSREATPAKVRELRPRREQRGTL